MTTANSPSQSKWSIARRDGNGLTIDGQGRAPARKDVGMLRHLKLCVLSMGEIVHTRAENAGRVGQRRELESGLPAAVHRSASYGYQ